MANVNPKEILKKLGFLKGIVAFLVPLLITAVGLVLIGAVLVLGARLRSNVQKESVQPANQIKSLMSKVDEVATAKQMEPYVKAYTQDVNAIENLVKGTTQRELLCYNIFPDTNERTTQLYEEFSHKYRSGLDTMLKSVKAGTAPTWSDIGEAMRKAGQRQVSPEMMASGQRKIFDNLCQEKAQAADVYASQMDIAGYTYWDGWKFENRDAAYRDCWYWQLGYWIVEDVMTTIREMNKGSTCVLDAPVKRLMNMDFVLGRGAGRAFIRRGTIMQQNRGGGKAGDNPIYVTGANDAMTAPCTGRYCNEQFDVVHFDVRVVVEAKSAMAFMKQLCTAKSHEFRGWKNNEPLQKLEHNQITILETSTVPVDLQTPVHNIHRYGDAPTVELDLICEYLFDKPTYEGMKPKQVKDDITSAVEAATKTK
jgi:hypothetical protein